MLMLMLANLRVPGHGVRDSWSKQAFLQSKCTEYETYSASPAFNTCVDVDVKRKHTHTHLSILSPCFQQSGSDYSGIQVSGSDFPWPLDVLQGESFLSKAVARCSKALAQRTEFAVVNVRSVKDRRRI